MAAPQGSEAQVGWKLGTRNDSFGQAIWQGPVNRFFRFKSMSGVVPKRTYARTENMDPSNQTLKGLPVQATIAPKFALNPDVNSVVRLLQHHAGKDATITTPAGGTTSRQWVIEPFETGDTAPATYMDDLIFEASDNDGFPILITGARMQDLDIKISSNKIQSVDLGFLACHDTYTSDATQVNLAGSYSGKPIVRGHWAAGTATPIKVRVTAGAGGGFDATVKWTTASYAGSTTIQIKFDTWYRITLDDGARAGLSRTEDLWFCFPSTSPSTTLTALDEWSFTSSRTVATASYSTLDPLHAAGVEFTVGGTTYYVKDIDIKISRPRSANFVVGSKYALSVQKNGPWVVTLTLNRDREDRDFLKKLIDASSAAVVVKMYGNVIEGTIDELWQIDFPNCQVTDDVRDVTTPNTLPEKIDLQAYRSGSTDLFKHTVICTLTAM